MEVFRKSAKFLSEGNVLSDKTGAYELLAKDEITDSDDEDGNVEENVLFEQPTAGTGKRNCRRLIPKLCWMACIAVALLAIAVVVVHITRSGGPLASIVNTPFGKTHKPLHKTHDKRFKKTPEWTVFYPGFDTESCVRLVDVDEDGRDDILFGMGTVEYVGPKMTSLDDMKKMCADANIPFPCAGMVVALRGYDGKELWRMNVTAGPFMINCGNIDVDKDGKMDCIASGRLGTASAFDPRKGKVLWDVDPAVVHQSWNFYHVLVMPDLTGDGVPEVLLSHGGDPKFKATQHKRYSGRLALVDGSNGRSLGRYLNMRRYKETYISPVLHTTKDGSQYILYGEGGETVKGSFLGISLPDFYRYVKNLPKSAPVPNTRGNYKSWEKRKWYHRIHGIFVIYKSKIKGVMVPPTLVDMNNDGVRDIMMTAYDGLMRLYDGDTLEVMWTTKFHGFESYSCLAPAYFNDDDTLDFMIQLNRGAWPHYSYALKVVLDGRNGKVLWTMNATWYGMASDLVLRTTEKHRDAFAFRMEGVNGPVDNGKIDLSQMYLANPKTYMDPPTTMSPDITGGHGGPLAENASTHTPKHNETENDRKFAAMYKEFFNNTDIDFSTFKDGDDKDDEEDEDEDENAGMRRFQQQNKKYRLALCSDDPKSYETQYMILDRSNVYAPNILYQVPSIKYFFNLTEADKKAINNELKNQGKKAKKEGTKKKRRFVESKTGPYCVLLQNDERTTGALGDVDGDGEMDRVAIVGSQARYYTEFFYRTTIIKMNIVDAVKTRGRYRDRLDVYVAEEMRNVRGVKPLEEMAFRPVDRQPWTQYMGTTSDGIYRANG